MAAMKRIPKFTAGMFKRKMPRFGASGIKMPRLPKPPKPRVKKFQSGGEIEEVIVGAPYGEVEEVIVGPGEYEKEESKDLVKRYMGASKRAAEEREDIASKIRRGSKGPSRRNRPKNRKELAKEAIDDMMRNPPYRKMVQELGTVKLNKSGGVQSSCCRGDGVAQRGKTRGKFV